MMSGGRGESKESKKAAETTQDKMTSAHRTVQSINRIAAKYPDREAELALTQGGFGKSDYAKDLNKFYRDTLALAKGLQGSEEKDELKKSQDEKAIESLTTALDTLKTQTMALGNKVYTGADSFTWEQKKWEEPFEPVKAELSKLSPSDPEKLKKLNELQQRLETLRTESIYNAAEAMKQQAERKLLADQYMEINPSFASHVEAGQKAKRLPKPASLTADEEEEIRKQMDAKDGVFKSTEEDEFGLGLKKIREYTGKYFVWQSGLYEGKMLEHSDAGCRPCSDFDKDNVGLYREAYGAAMDLMQMHDPNGQMTFGFPAITAVKPENNPGVEARLAEIEFRNNFTAEFVRDKIISVMDESTNGRAAPFELDDDLRNYMVLRQQEAAKEWFHDIRESLRDTADSYLHKWGLKSQDAKSSLVKTIDDAFRKEAELKSAAARNKVIGARREDMQSTVDDTTEQLKQQPKGTLQADYDKIKNTDYPEVALGNKPPPAALSKEAEGARRLEDKKQADARDAAIIKKLSVDFMKTLAEKSQAADPKAEPKDKATLIKAELAATEAQIKAVVQAGHVVTGQISALDRMVTETRGKSRGQELVNNDEFLQKHVDQLEGLRKLQEEKLAELTIKTKLLHQATKDLTEKDFPKDSSDAPSAARDSLLGRTHARVAAVEKQNDVCKAAEASVTLYKGQRTAEQKQQEQSQAQSHASGPGAPGGPTVSH